MYLGRSALGKACIMAFVLSIVCSLRALNGMFRMRDSCITAQAAGRNLQPHYQSFQIRLRDYIVQCGRLLFVGWFGFS